MAIKKHAEKTSTRTPLKQQQVAAVTAAHRGRPSVTPAQRRARRQNIKKARAARWKHHQRISGN